MTKWTIIQRGGATVVEQSNGGDELSYNFPKNDTASDIIYDVNAEDNNGCTATTSVTVPVCLDSPIQGTSVCDTANKRWVVTFTCDGGFYANCTGTCSLKTEDGGELAQTVGNMSSGTFTMSWGYEYYYNSDRDAEFAFSLNKNGQALPKQTVIVHLDHCCTSAYTFDGNSVSEYKLDENKAYNKVSVTSTTCEGINISPTNVELSNNKWTIVTNGQLQTDHYYYEFVYNGQFNGPEPCIVTFTRDSSVNSTNHSETGIFKLQHNMEIAPLQLSTHVVFKSLINGILTYDVSLVARDSNGYERRNYRPVIGIKLGLLVNGRTIGPDNRPVEFSGRTTVDLSTGSATATFNINRPPNESIETANMNLESIDTNSEYYYGFYFTTDSEFGGIGSGGDGGGDILPDL